MVVIHASGDWVTPTPTCCFQVSTTTAFDTISGVVLTRNRQCSNLRLCIGIIVVQYVDVILVLCF
jgi:hypothetical protein